MKLIILYLICLCLSLLSMKKIKTVGNDINLNVNNSNLPDFKLQDEYIKILNEANLSELSFSYFLQRAFIQNANESTFHIAEPDMDEISVIAVRITNITSSRGMLLGIISATDQDKLKKVSELNKCFVGNYPIYPAQPNFIKNTDRVLNYPLKVNDLVYFYVNKLNGNIFYKVNTTPFNLLCNSGKNLHMKFGMIFSTQGDSLEIHGYLNKINYLNGNQPKIRYPINIH